MKSFIKTLTLFGLSGLLLACTADGSHATAIILRNTGETSSGNLQANEGKDGNFILTKAPAGADVKGPFITNSHAFPISTGDWHPELSDAQWISPQDNYNGDLSDPAGVYDFTEFFTLPSDFTGAEITGEWAADNFYDGIYINGKLVPGTVNMSESSSNFNALTSFIISSGFQSGINTLTFQEVNASGCTGNPTGLLVQMSGTYTAGRVVPEPSGAVALPFGLLGISGLLLRRRKAFSFQP